MQRNTASLVMFLAALSGGFAARAEAQQLKPYFLVIVDTSGSMAWCAGGETDYSCRAGGAMNGAFTNNRCGFPSNRIGDAKCALQRIIDGNGGDAVFGLMQFEHPCDANCNATGGQCSGSQGMCSANCDDAQLAVEITTGNATRMREWVDGQCGGGACGTNSFKYELTTGQWTPLAKSLQRANEYLRQGSSAGLLYVTGGNAPQSPLVNDPQLKCRPVSVILLTDGDDTCTGNPTNDPPSNAALLWGGGDPNSGTPSNKAFKTYVIGFGTGGNFNAAVLDNIATQGHTDSPDATHKYFPAANEQQLSLAFNQIIADSQPPAEICNNADDDCDSKIDEGLPKYCDKPKGINTPTLCDEPMETNCDGQDDDCDGLIDEGITNECGKCGPVDKEVCDNTDNDCDSRVDEGTNTLAACGNDKGECEPGKLVCTGGVEQCQGEIGGSPEICDCKDNDCDGIVDEEGSAGAGLCGMGKRCAGCECKDFCTKVTEFDARCSPGLAPEFQPNGECLCIEDKCNHMECPKSTIKRDSMNACAPDDQRVSECICRAGACVPRCDGVSCESGKICNPKSGVCVENNCRGLGCVTGELCDPMTTRCVKDACATAKCDADQVCRDGKCETSCVKVRCDSGQKCEHGECVEDKCAKAGCENGQACDPNTGECAPDKCTVLLCPPAQECSQSTGMCEVDPCWTVKCPKNQVCNRGECIMGGSPQTIQPTTTTSAATDEAANRILATGGGGCACNVPGRPSSGSDASGLGWLLGALGVFLWRGRRRPARRLRRLQALAYVALACGIVLWGGCRVTPLCLDCVDSGSDTTDTGTIEPPAPLDDAGTMSDAEPNKKPDAGDAQVEASVTPVDSGMKCVKTGEETCNGKDDDCDLRVDEDVKPTSNSCNQAGVCSGTVPVCSSGMFVCRYATTYEKTESLCDGLDNDCNGKVDESFAQLGAACDVGTGACKVTGNMRCNAAHTGLMCEVKTVVEPAQEVCNGKDDDCDGMIDEPKGAPGTNASYVKENVVKVRNDLWMYTYEASRMDATDAVSGIVNTRSCSRAGVMPWTNVTYTEAVAACQGAGMALCGLNDWLGACKGSSGSCDWAVSPCVSSVQQFEGLGNNGCNGHNVSATPGSPDTDALKPTGSKAQCYADFGGAGHIFDVSGNAKEWTTGSMSPSQNPLRGGSYNNNGMGLRCDFDFTVAAETVRLPNVGFRCCSNTEP